MASAGSAKRKRKDVSLKTKYEALIELENGKTNKEVAESFGIPQNTVSTWKANKAKIVTLDICPDSSSNQSSLVYTLLSQLYNPIFALYLSN